MSRPLGGFIGYRPVPANSGLNSTARGMWTLREAQRLKQAGTWPFTLTEFGNLQLWLDFSNTSSISLSGGNISQIDDLSGNGFHAVQPTSSNMPGQSTINGLNCGDWGTSQNSKSLRMTTGSADKNWREVAVVAVWDAGGTTFPGFNGLFGGGSGTGTQSGTGLLGSQGTANWLPIGNTGQFDSWISTVVLNGNETVTAFNTINSTFCIQFRRSSDIAVVGYSVGSDRGVTDRGWRGRICEVIAYSKELTTSNRTALRSYLSTKWGIA